MEQQLPTRLRKGQIAEFVKNHEVLAAQIIGQPPRPAFGLELVDQINNVEEPPACAVADASPSYRNRQMRLAGPGAADQHDIALLCQEVTAREIANQRLIDR